MNQQQEVSSAETKRPRLLWHNILFMTITPILSAVLVPLYILENGFSWGLVAIALAWYVVTLMCITCGYHRYFSHRSYDAHRLVEIFYILFGAGAFQSSVLQWSTDHRRHHRVVDTDEDPYSINKGFLYAHLTWMFKEDLHPESHAYPKDLTKNPWIMWQHNHYVLIASFMGFVVPGLIAWALGLGFWGGVLFGGLLRVVIAQHSTFLINSAAHVFGTQTYNDKHTARDSFWLAFLTFGEGYHNFHHSFQADYRNGIRWYDWDPSKWCIRALASLGLASRLKQAHKEEILKARIAMEERQLISRGVSAEKVAQLKMRILESQKKVKALRDSYLNARRELSEKGKGWKKMMRAEIRMAEVEFRAAYGQWRIFKRAVERVQQAA